eukprot:COSAG02_NODE_62166_length_266_cov_1.173653_1_plen_65_part_10
MVAVGRCAQEALECQTSFAEHEESAAEAWFGRMVQVSTTASKGEECARAYAQPLHVALFSTMGRI